MDQPHVPLEALKFPYYCQSRGEIEELSGLDPNLCQDVTFPKYQSAPNIQPEMDPCIWQNWIESLTSIEKNLSWLLKLPHAKFWCQAVNNASLQACLDSYLKQTPRFQSSSWPDEVLEKHNVVHKLVFLVYIRMATHKESSSHFITPDYFGEIIYENYLFDIPKIMDLCAIYGNETNQSFLGKAISNVFKHQPSYNEDLKETVKTIMQIFRNIDEKCGLHYQGDTSSDSTTRRPHRLSEGPSSGDLTNMSFREFRDLVLYASDVLFTLGRFLVDVYPKACSAFYEHVKYFAHFYSTTLCCLNEAVMQKSVDDLHLRSQLLAHLKISRKSLLSVIRQITIECLLDPALNASDAGDHARANNLADEYLQLLSDFLGETIFFQDFLKKLPIIDDVQSLLQTVPGIDETRAAFILGSLGSGKHQNKTSHVPNVIVNGTDEQNNAEATGHKTVSTDVKVLSTNTESDMEMSSLISTVHDVLPHLSEEYIKSCLIYYEKDCEKTIHALLEGSLPDDLRAMENSSGKKSAVQSNDHHPEEKAIDGNVLQDRKNVFDNDEFDIYGNSNVDVSRIHKGKRTKSSHSPVKTDETRQIYEKYSIVYDEEDISDEFESLVVHDTCNVYDDEYDDMYDGLGVDANDVDNADDLLKRRPFVTPRVFLQAKKESSSKSDESEANDDEDNSPKPDHFIANPADVRAKQEERRRQQQELRNNRRGKKPHSHISANDGKSNAARDHKKKDANKARIANHNRKQMSTKKAAKGMGPI